ncbi:Glutamate [NMDA] receptor subunit 1 [Nymphon striatum]|nr:Glutamate [NMDA] receptor subunit 1 [Nymphon striatum]
MSDAIVSRVRNTEVIFDIFGVLGLELPNAKNNTVDHIHDAVEITAMAIRKMYENDRENFVPAPSSCSRSNDEWITGQKLVSYIKQQSILGKTGKVAFDESGDRIFAEYNVINVVNGQRKNVGSFTYSKKTDAMKLELRVEKVSWPGEVTEKPVGVSRAVSLKSSNTHRKAICIRRISRTNDKYCCYGYCMELLKQLAERLNFTYEVHLEEDNIFGAPVKKNGSQEQVWTGLIAELLENKADMAMAALTITPERSQVIDFTKPFKYQGITILEKMQNKSSLLASFLQPFQRELWILVMVSVHVVALALYLLDRFSPFGRYRLPNSDATEEDALNLSSAIWFAWGVLLNSGIGEGTPRSFSARVLGMVWAGFAMIVVASYTANLAAFLVLDRPDTSLTGINDARLRNPVENFTYATVKKSAVDMYFRKQVELSNITLNAFIWDSARLDYEAAQDCSLETTGELFGRSGIGIGFVKNSYWCDPTTLSILEMHESGYMEELDKDWIYGRENTCEKQEKGPVTLGLKNMGGVFILVGAGIVGGIGLIVIEIVYKKHQTSKQKKMELARHAADKWRGAVANEEETGEPWVRRTDQKRKIIRASIENQKKMKTNGMEILASGSLDRHCNAIPDATSHFSSFRPLPSPEVRLRNQQGSSSIVSSGSGIRPIYHNYEYGT